MILAMTLLTGFVYTALITFIGTVAFHDEVSGSLLKNSKGQVVGSGLLAQKFESPRYFWPRPSAADFATVPSGASNLGPTSADLKTAVEKREKTLLESTTNQAGKVPEELLFASASGLDPHLSPASVIFQIHRVVKARGFNEGQKVKLEKLIDALVENRASWLGDPIINVLLLNLALDQLS